ncbi:isochorismatase family protein [Methanoculleus sp. FWC-SCC1]|uniref:Isochorismatase family protein n=1 Tax=Methanoculleus frigidifontis TaxID=2584085 RepID=A0ABT8MDQ1_9EURY|nr:isochorismatase family protein [Methanoculleus sp. FWC-SCC1]MDN7026051.1 isochorismatase family protein [Methanoculleus sp. FWC-SCC1]
MKEEYFTPETIDAIAGEMLGGVIHLRNRHPVRCTPERSALLVIDMQRYFLDEGSHAYVPGSRAILPKIRALIDGFARAGGQVIFTRHVNTPADAGSMAVWWRGMITDEAGAADLAPGLDRREFPVVVKSQYDAFYGTSLEAMLRDSGVEQVAVAGVMTHLCCETTARSAFVRGFSVLFPVDGTATYTAELHRASLCTLAHGFAVPLLVSELLELVHEAGTG